MLPAWALMTPVFQGRSDLLEIGRSGRLGLWEAQRIDIFVVHPVGQSDMVSWENPQLNGGSNGKVIHMWWIVQQTTLRSLIST
jgi:hypothetical protein